MYYLLITPVDRHGEIAGTHQVLGTFKSIEDVMDHFKTSDDFTCNAHYDANFTEEERYGIGEQALSDVRANASKDSPERRWLNSGRKIKYRFEILHSVREVIQSWDTVDISCYK